MPIEGRRNWCGRHGPQHVWRDNMPPLRVLHQVQIDALTPLDLAPFDRGDFGHSFQYLPRKPEAPFAGFGVATFLVPRYEDVQPGFARRLQEALPPFLFQESMQITGNPYH